MRTRIAAIAAIIVLTITACGPSREEQLRERADGVAERLFCAETGHGCDE